jgi:exonuclease SbcC
MQLRGVRVTNVRSYESGHVDFAPGTTLLVGDVGAGKTSLLYAIEMALFGTAEVDAAYLVRHGALHAEVAVAFEDDAHRYEVRRRFRRVRRKGKETFEPEKTGFTVDGEATEYSVTELRQRVIDLLGFPDNPNPQAHSDLWRWAVYVPQERMRDILGAKAQDRLETVRKALGVERYRTAAENAAELATDLRRSAEARRREADLLRHFDEEYAEWSERGDALRAQRPTTVADREASRLALEGQRTRFAALEERARAIEADARELTGLERELREATDRLGALDRRRNDRRSEAHRREVEAAEARTAAADLPRLQSRLTVVEQERRGANLDHERLAAELRALSEARGELTHVTRRRADADAERVRARAERDRARSELAASLSEGPAKEPPAPTPESVGEIEDQLARSRSEEAAALQEMVQARAAVRELDELLGAGVCPRCHQPVRPTEFEAHRSEAEAEAARRTDAHAARSAATTALEDRRRARERYERARDRWVEAERRRAAARIQLAGAEESEARAAAAEAEAAGALAEAERRVAERTPSERADRDLRAQLAELETRRTTAAGEIEHARLAEERARAAERTILAVTEEIGRLDLEEAAVRTQSLARAARIAELGAVADRRASIAGERTGTEAAVRAAEGELAARDGELSRLDVRLDEAVRRVATAEKGRAERAQLTAEGEATTRAATWVGRAFRETVLRMEQKLLQHAQTAFERNFARYFASLVDDPALAARTDLTFTPAVTIDGEWTPAQALSGGERTSLALAFRLALSQVVRSMGNLHLETILLDEPTDGFSPEQVVRMGELLDELGLPQVVLVSHETQLASIADRVVRVEKKDGRSSLAGPGSAGPRDGPDPD